MLAFVKGLEHEFLKQSSSLSYKRFVDDSKDQFLFGLPFHHHYHIILIIILEFFSYILFLVLFWKRFACIYVFQGGILIVRSPLILEILDFVETVKYSFLVKVISCYFFPPFDTKLFSQRSPDVVKHYGVKFNVKPNSSIYQIGPKK